MTSLWKEGISKNKPLDGSLFSTSGVATSDPGARGQAVGNWLFGPDPLAGPSPDPEGAAQLLDHWASPGDGATITAEGVKGGERPRPGPAQDLNWEDQAPIGTHTGISPINHGHLDLEEATLKQIFAQNQLHRLTQVFGHPVTPASVQEEIAAARQAGHHQEAERLRMQLFRATQQAIIDTLDVESMGDHGRYGRHGGRTSCNFYARDLTQALGARAEGRLANGNANALNRWLNNPNQNAHWTFTASAAEAQQAANDGRIVIASGHATLNSSLAPGREPSGHVTVLVAGAAPQDEEVADADRDPVNDKPNPPWTLQTQAGGNNQRYIARGDWQNDERHRGPAGSRGGFWIYTGPIDSPLGPADSLGVVSGPYSPSIPGPTTSP